MIRRFAALSLLLVFDHRPRRRAAEREWRRRRPGTSTRPPARSFRRFPMMNVNRRRLDERRRRPNGPDAVAFDLLGDIYTMPIAGGQPERGSPPASPSNMQPRFFHPTDG